MKMNNQQLMSEFFKEINKDIDIDYEQLKDICFGPWRYLKQEIESGKLPAIRFKYFGTFQVYKGRAENMLYNLNKKWKNNEIGEDQYFKYKEMIEDYLKRINDEN